MKKLLFFLLVTSVFSVVGMANAIPIDSNVIVRADFDLTGQTTPPPYDLITVAIQFDCDINGGQEGEGFNTSFFDSADNLVNSKSQTFTEVPSGYEMWAGAYIPLFFDGNIYTPSINDYIILDNIVGSFELDSIRVIGRRRTVQNPDPANPDHFENTGVVDTQLTVSPIPEPTTMLLLGAGLIGLAGLGRKRFVRKS